MLACIFSCTPSSEELIHEGKTLLDNGQHERAVKVLELAVKENEKSSDAYNVLGVAYFEMKNFPEAIQQFDKSLALDSTSYIPYYNRANANREQGKFVEALGDYSKAINLKPNIKDIYLNRGVVFYTLERYEQALEDFNFALQLDQNDAQTYFKRAKTAIMLDSMTLAKADLEQTIAKQPDFAEAFYWLGLAEITLEDQAQGCLYLKQARQLGYKDAATAVKQYCEEEAK